ncbi:LysR family substrate-binding domain-containing protein [Vibrio sp. PP-XX7]
MGFDYGLERKYLPYISSMLQQQRQVELIVRSLPALTLLNEVRQGKIDVTFLHPTVEMHGVAYKILGHSPLIAAMHQDHPLAQRERLSAKALATEQIVTPSEHFGPTLYQASVDFGRHNGINFNISYQAETLTMAIALMQSMKHVCLLPQYSQHQFPENIKIVQLEENVPEIPYAMVWHPDNPAEAIPNMLATFNTNNHS